jgi:outer membrane usher protein FimD/PapC
MLYRIQRLQIIIPDIFRSSSTGSHERLTLEIGNESFFYNHVFVDIKQRRNSKYSRTKLDLSFTSRKFRTSWRIKSWN